MVAIFQAKLLRNIWIKLGKDRSQFSLYNVWHQCFSKYMHLWNKFANIIGKFFTIFYHLVLGDIVNWALLLFQSPYGWLDRLIDRKISRHTDTLFILIEIQDGYGWIIYSCQIAIIWGKWWQVHHQSDVAARICEFLQGPRPGSDQFWSDLLGEGVWCVNDPRSHHWWCVLA